MDICNGVPSTAALVTFGLAPRAALQTHILDLYQSISHGPSLTCNRNSDHIKHYLLGILISEPVNIILTTYYHATTSLAKAYIYIAHEIKFGDK